MAKKYWWEEDESKTTTQNNAQTKKQPEQSKKNTKKQYWWDEDEVENKTERQGYWWDDNNIASDAGSNIVNRVNSWLQNHNSFVSEYQKRYEGRKYDLSDSYVSDSADWLDQSRQRKDSLNKEADEILSYIDQYKGYLDEKWVENIRKSILGAKGAQGHVLNVARNDNEFWTRFTPNEEQTAAGYTAEKVYNEWQKEQKQYAEDLVYDIEAGLLELDRLKKEGSTSNNRISELEERIERAKYVQGYEGYMANMDAEDYAANSQYVSKRTGVAEDDARYGFGELFSFIGGEGDRLDLSKLYDDVTYDYINRNPDAIAHVGVNETADNAYFLGFDKGFLQTMTDDEIGVYNYIYKTQGKEAAGEFLNFIDNDLKGRQIAQEKAFWAAYAKSDPVGSSVFSALISPLKGVSYIGQIADMVEDGELEQNARHNRFSYIPNTIRSQVSQTIEHSGKWGKVGSFAYNTGMSMADFLFTTAVSGGYLGGEYQYLSLAIMGSGAAADATLAAKDRGLPDKQAFALGTIAGIAEVAMEKISLGAWLEGDMTEGALRYLLKNAFTEAGEEAGTSTINLLADIMIAGDKSEWNTAMQAYIDKGKSEAEAFGLVAAEQASQIGLDALGGFLSGAAISGGTYAGTSIGANFEYGDTAKDKVASQQLVTEGLELNPESQYVQKMQTKLDSGKKLTGMQVRNILAANQEQITAKDMQKIQKAAEARLTELGQTEDVSELARIATKWATGKTLTPAERKTLTHSQYGSRVANELLPSSIQSGGYTTEWAENIGTRQVNKEAYNKEFLDKWRAAVDEISKGNDPATYNALDERVDENDKLGISETGKATIRESGVEIDLSKPEIVDFVKDKETGKVTDMTLNVDGKEVKASEIDYADDSQSYLYSAVKNIENITPGDAQAIIRGYDSSSGLSVGEYLNGIDEAYTYGYHNYSEADMGAGVFTSKLSSEQAKGAYLLGQTAKNASKTTKTDAIKRMRTAVEAEAEKAKAEGKPAPKAKKMSIAYNEGNGKVVDFDKANLKLTTKQKAAPALAQVFHEMGLGTNFELFASHVNKNGVRVYIDENGVERKAPSGAYRMKDGTVRIDLNAYNGRGLTLDVMAHELTHFIQEWSDTKYQALAEFLVQTYEKTDMTMHERVLREQSRLERVRGEKVSYNEAFDEVVANAMSKMLADGNVMARLNELMAKDADLAQKLWTGLKKLLNKFFRVSEKQSALFHDAADLMELKAEFKQMQQLWADAFVEASENFRTSLTAAESQTLTEAGIGFDESTKSVYSLHFSNAYQEQIQVGKKTFDAEAVAQLVSKATNRSIEDARKWVQSEMTIANIVMQNPEFLDFEADNRYEAIKKNSDYPQGTVDLSNLCPKREEFTTMFDMLQKKYPNKLFTAQDVADMRKILAENDITVACGACFVEDRRQLLGEIADSYINMWKEAVESGKPLQKTNAAGVKSDLLVTKALAKQYGLTAGTQIMATDTYIPNQYDLTTYEGFKKLEKNHPTIAMGFNRYNNSRGQQSARLIEGRAEYNRQILGWTDAKVRSVNNNGGLRIFSFSDFEVVHLLDLVQVIIDCAAKGVKIQGYTKIPAFAKLVRNTGVKLNRSLIPKGDYGYHMENGKVVLGYDTTEGIDINDKNFIDESNNPNVGNIVIGINPTQIGAAMLDPFIDYIIPFHSNKAKEILRKLGTGEWVNYKESQHEKDIATGSASKRNVNIYTEVINKYHPTNKVEFVEAFLKECKQQGKIPRYAEFLNVDANGDYAYREGYHKLLVDFKMFDAEGNILPQGNITPNLDENFMKELLNAEIDKKQNYEFPQEVYDAIDKKFGENSLDNSSAGRENNLTENQERGETNDNGGVRKGTEKPASLGRTDGRTNPGNAGVAQTIQEWGNQTAAVQRVVKKVVKTHINQSANADAIYRLLCAYVGKSDNEMNPNSYSKAVEVLTEKLYSDSMSMALDLFKGKWRIFGGSVDNLYHEIRDTADNPDSAINEITSDEYQQLVNHFGTTKNYNVAGYLLKNGLMLDFSGKHWGDTSSKFRQVDHRDVGDAWETKAPNDVDDMVHMIANGNIRLMPESGGINLAVMPNKSQLMVLRGYIDHFRGEVIVDVDRVGDDTIHSFSYNKGTSSSRIIADIKAYFENGKVPEPQSDIGKFLFSSQETDRDSQGKQLSEDQKEFFEHSKARDESGNLYVLFHGSKSPLFTEFDVNEGVWLTPDQRYAETYAEVWHSWRDENQNLTGLEQSVYADPDYRLYKMYANITNPLDIGEINDDFDRNQLNRLAKLLGVPASQVKSLAYDKHGQETIAFVYQLTKQKEFIDIAKAKGYDGFVATEKGRKTFCAFNAPNQVKLTTNEVPSGFYDVRYSTQETDNISNRDLLANAFEGITKNSAEYEMIQEYKGRVKLLNEYEEKLSKLNSEIRKMLFDPNTERDAKKLQELQTEAKKVSENINRNDKKLLSLEASEPLRKVIERERKKEAQKTKDHVKEIQQNKKARAEQTEYRHKIRKTIRDLDKILNRGNKKQNVKEDMKGFVSKALELADYLFTDHISNDELIRKGITVRMTAQEESLVRETEDILTKIYDEADSLTDEEFTKLDAKRKANEEKLRDLLKAQRNEKLNTPVYQLFDDLATEYASLKNSSQDAVKAAYSEEVERLLRTFTGEADSDRAAVLKNMRVADMTTEELWKLYNAYTMVLTTVRDANKFHVKGMNVSIEQVVGQIAGDFGSRKIPDKKLAIALQKIGNKIGWNYEKLYYALDRIGSVSFTKLIENLANSENTVMRDVQEAIAFRDQIVEKYGFNNWAVNKEIDREFLDNTGKKFRLTLGQLMALYAYSRREGAWDHIEYGGFVFGEAALTNPRPADSYKLSKEQCEAITSLLTNEQKGYVEDMQKFLSETMGAKGNEVSMLLYGIKMFGEKNYFPIHIAGQFKAQANESQAKAAAGFSSMSNAGFTHAQNPNAKAPFVLEGFNEVWSDHVNEMSRYHGTVPALEDIRRVMNRSTYSDSVFESQSIKQLMENSFGKEAVDYFDSLYREANSGAIQDKLQRIPKKLLSLFRKNSVAYSLSVIIQQPSAMARAYALIDKKYFGFHGVGALTSGVVKAVSSKWNPAYANTYNKMLKYAPGVTMAKEIGGFDTHTGTSIREYLLDTNKSLKQKWKTENALGKAKAALDVVDNNAIANLPNVADKIAWIEIWNACEREAVATRKDIVPNSEEFLQAVGDRFTEVIRATQVYDSIFAKSPMLKSKNLAVQYLVSFMNEPNTTANMVEKAVRDAVKGNWKSGVRTAAAVTYSIIFNNVLKAIVYAMRDDDEDEAYIEKYLAAVAGGMMDDFNPINYIPIARDAWSKANGYDVERPDVAIIADAIEAIQAKVKYNGKDTENMTEEQIAELDKKITDANWKLVGSLAAFFGIPVKNVYREIEGVIDHARIASANAGMATPSSVWDKVKGEILDSIPFAQSQNTKQDKLYEAIINGDKAYLARLKSGYKTDDAYHTAVRKALRENDPRIKEAALAEINGDPSERVRIAKLIKADGFDQNDVVMAINAEINEMTKTESDSGTTKVKGFYKTEDFVREYANGDLATLGAIREDILDTDQKNGKTLEKAEKDFVSDVRSKARDVYLDGSLDDATAEKLLVEYADMDEEEAASSVDYWSFLKENPEYADLSESNVSKYKEFAEPENISLDVYAQFINGTKGLTEIKDEWGDVEVTKREQVLEVIDSLPLTWQQKDALYLAAGYSENKIWDVPW